MGYLNEYETPLTPMEERGYYDEKGNLDIDAVEADGYEFGMDLAFGVLSVYEGKPERVLEIQKYVNEQYECCSNRKFMKVLETIARMNGNEEVYIEDMYACNKEARNYYLSELMMCFNFVFNEMCHGTGSAANCDFDVEEQENIMADFEYFRAEESDQFSFFRIPKALFTDCLLYTSPSPRDQA